MMRLGGFLVADTATFNESRRKVLRLALALGFGDIAATRLAGAFSELCRAGVGGPGLKTDLGLVPYQDGLALAVSLDYPGGTRPSRAAGAFFREFGPLAGAERSFRGLLPLPDRHFHPDESFLDAQRDMLAQPSREELLRDLQSKNAALEQEIRERKQAEEALRRSEQRTLAVLEGAPDALLMVNEQGRITYLNPQTERVFGYPAAELLGQSIDLLVPAASRSSHGDRVRSYFAAPRERIFGAVSDLHAETRDGRIISVDVKLNPIATEQGAQVIVSVRDVTEQKKAQETVKKLSLVVQQSTSAVVITDREARIEYVNQAFSAITGYSAEEVMGRNPSLLQSGQTPGDSFCELWRTILSGQAWRGVLVNRKKSGEVYWDDSIILPIQDASGRITHFAAVKEDITERMRMEEAVRESELKYRELVENANSIILKLDMAGNITFFNEFAQKFFGFRQDEILGRSIVGTIVPESESTGKDLAAFIADLVLNPEQYARNENENVTKTGERVWVGWTNQALTDDANGAPIGVLCVGSDITAQKIAQMQRDEALELLSGSIRYASRIQQAVLPAPGLLEDMFREHFVLWDPRDVVGGDIYWCVPWGRGWVFVLGDCTGHGVPGAFMTLIATGALGKALRDVEPGDTSRLMAATHRLVQTGLGQHVEGGGSDDGMELGMCYLPDDKGLLRFCGARFSLFHMAGGELAEHKGDRKGIGYRGIPLDFRYMSHDFPLGPGQRFFMTSDGLLDQIGGEKRRSYGKKRFSELLLELSGTPLAAHPERIKASLADYQGAEKRRDDVSVVGFSVL